MIIQSNVFQIFNIFPLKKFLSMWRFYNEGLKSYENKNIVLMNGKCLSGSPVHICTYMCLFPPAPYFIMALVISMGLKQCYCIKTKLSAWRGSTIMEVQFYPGGSVEHNILHVYKYISNHSNCKRILQPCLMLL